MTSVEATIGVELGERSIDVSLELNDQETVVLVGPNGAGKSTIVKAVAGIVPLDRGRIIVDGTAVDDPGADVFVPPALRKVGVVLQGGGLFDHMNVLDNVSFGLVAKGHRRRRAHDMASEWLERFDIQGLASRRPASLSGGEMQRVALARTLAASPNVLLLDEPFAAVDVAARPELRRVVDTHLRSFAGPRLIVTHEPTDVYLFADRVVVVEDGRVTQAAAPEEIRRHPATDYAAALAGVNLLRGVASAGEVRITGSNGGSESAESEFVLTVADTNVSGSVLVTIAPNAVVIHEERPSGSARNVWATRVAAVESLGDVSRVLVDSPVPLAIDVTPESVDRLGLAADRAVWVSVKATELEVRSA